MRGTLERSDALPGDDGIIPAYAGNTRGTRRACRWPWDHPRVCGEHQYGERITVRKRGSSPRMRGTPAIDIVAQVFLGIIPAYAGNTQTHSLENMADWDHPRVCGEHLVGQAFFGLLQGSSPRMRGTLGFFENPSRQTGIIPAYAGNTGCLIAPVRRRWDHPRVCGEHPTCFSRSSKVLGSSPRMRGTHPNRTAYHVRRGIIPAYAGNTEPL